MIGKSADLMKEMKQTVANMQKAESGMNEDEADLETKKLILTEKNKEMDKKVEDLKNIREKALSEVAKLESINITEENVLEYVKPPTPAQENWLKYETKRKAIDDGIQILKEFYENGDINLRTLVDSTRKLGSKQFMAIYKRQKFEGLARKEGRIK